MTSPKVAAKVACVWPARALLGEGPSWDARSCELIWVDIKGRAFFALEVVSGRQRQMALPFRLCSVAAPRAPWVAPSHRHYLGSGDFGFGWVSIDHDRVSVEPLANPEAGNPENRYNDGKLGPPVGTHGRYFAGSMHDPETEVTGRLYAFGSDGSVILIDSGYKVPNGPAFSPAGRVMYHTDSARQIIYAFDVSDDGSIGNKRTFATFAEGEGYPDGMTVDAAGNLWIAFWDGWRVEKISPAGKRLGHVAIPTARPTSCAFAGDGAGPLYVTSAAIGRPADDALAGALFRIDLE